MSYIKDKSSKNKTHKTIIIKLAVHKLLGYSIILTVI